MLMVSGHFALVVAAGTRRDDENSRRPPVGLSGGHHMGDHFRAVDRRSDDAALSGGAGDPGSAACLRAIHPPTYAMICTRRNSKIAIHWWDVNESTLGQVLAGLRPPRGALLVAIAVIALAVCVLRKHRRPANRATLLRCCVVKITLAYSRCSEKPGRRCFRRHRQPARITAIATSRRATRWPKASQTWPSVLLIDVPPVDGDLLLRRVQIIA